MSKIAAQSKNRIIKRRRPYKKKKIWKHSEELLLLSLWSETFDVTTGQRKSAHTYDQIRDELAAADCIVSNNEIRFKLNNLTAKYKKEKEDSKKKGKPSSWVFYKNVDEIIGDQIVTKGGKHTNAENAKTSESFEFRDFQLSAPYSLENKSVELLDLPTPSNKDSDTEMDNIDDFSDHNDSLAINSSIESLDDHYLTENPEITLFEQRLLEKMNGIHTEMIKQNEILVQQQQNILEQEEKRTRLLKRFLMESLELKDAFMSFLRATERPATRN